MTIQESVYGMLCAARDSPEPARWAGWPVLADALQEWRSDLPEHDWQRDIFERMRSHRLTGDDVEFVFRFAVLPQLDDSDLQNAFGYAGEPGGCGTGSVQAACPGSDCDTSSFRRSDVAMVTGISHGENDGPDWLVLGRLHDGRWFALKAGCDNTGWG